MADDTQPSDRAVGAARYLRMVGATRRRRRPAEQPAPPPEVDTEETIDPIDYAEAFRMGPQGEGADEDVGRVIDAPEIVIEGDAGTFVDSLRHSTPEIAEEARRRRDRDAQINDVQQEGFDDSTPLSRAIDDAEDLPAHATSYIRGLGQSVSLDHMDEILGGLDTAGDVLTGRHSIDEIPEAYRLHQRGRQRDYEESRDLNPALYNLGQGTGIIGSFLSPAGPLARWIGNAPTAGGRIWRSTMAGGTLGGIAGEGSSDAPITDEATQQRIREGVGMGSVLGGSLATVGEGLRSVGQAFRGRAPTIADAMEPTAARARVRSAGARTVGQQRLVEDLPGGAVDAARDLDRLGIARRGELGLTPTEAGSRAGRALSDAQTRLRAVFERMRQVTDGQTPMVDMSGVADELDGIANQLDFVGAEGQSDAAMQLATEIRQQGSISFDTAQRMKRFYDSLINWNAAANPTSRLSPLASQRMIIRGAVRDAMDNAVGEVDPTMVPQYQQARRDYQVADTFNDLANDSEMRDAANRLASPSDQAAGALGVMREGAAGALWGLANRLMRQREHSFFAGTMERTIDALRRVAARSPETAPLANTIARQIAENPRQLASLLEVLEAQHPQAMGAIHAAMAQDAPASRQPNAQQIDPELDALQREYGLDAAQDDEEELRRLSAEYGIEP